MAGRRLLALVLLSVCGIGCTESGTPTSTGVAPSSNVSTTSSAGVNNTLAGEIWIADIDGTERFNLQTGVQTNVSNGLAIPSKDGSVYLEYLPNFGIVEHDYCPIAPSYYDAQVFRFKNTRSGELLSSFILGTDVAKSSIRLSPDGERIAMYVAEDTKACESNTLNKRFSIYSKEGKLLHRNTVDYFESFDWDPNGRLVVLRKLPQTDRKYVMQIESSPGSHEFTDLFAFDAPPEVVAYHGLRVGPTGNDAVLEAVTQTPTPLAGISYRDAKTLHFTLFEIIEESDMFQYKSGDTARVNGPTFSPDGKHILVTEGYSSGAAVFFQNYPELDQIDSLLIAPLSANRISYIVPVDVKEQPMPPEQYSENIRPVIANQSGQLGIIGFNPLYNLSWTPAID